VLLPKLPSTQQHLRVPAKPALAIKVIKPQQQAPAQFVVTSAASAQPIMKTAAPIGTAQNPIQLIQVAHS
jgi:hypothetical protein